MISFHYLVHLTSLVQIIANLERLEKIIKM